MSCPSTFLCLSVFFKIYVLSCFITPPPAHAATHARTQARYSATPSAGCRPACSSRPWHASPPASQHTRTDLVAPRSFFNPNTSIHCAHSHYS
eukprot:3556275-Pleurochrysis_carterae.AAC.1